MVRLVTLPIWLLWAAQPRVCISNPVRYSPLLFSAFATGVICSNIGVGGRKMMVTPPVRQGRVWCIFSFLRYRLLTLSCHPTMACAVWSGCIDLADLLYLPQATVSR